MSIVFFGTSEFAVPALKALVKAGYDIAAIVTMPDQPTGRKQTLSAPPVKLAALELGLSVVQPETLKNTHLKFEADLGIVAAYGKIIPQQIIDQFGHGILNIHPSLLPKYRGPSPVQTSILNGDSETGVTIMQLDAGMDTGPTLSAKEVQINSQESYTELHNRLADLGAQLLIEAIPQYIDGHLKPKPQDDGLATVTKKFEREDGKINGSENPDQINNQIRALNPEPGTWTTWKGKILNIKKAHIDNHKLAIDTLQLESKKETTFTDFLHGYPDFNIQDCK